MSTIFKKPSDMRWVDLAIWVDENFYKEDCDYNKAYEYIWLLAYMLSLKHKYFESQRDYEDFASSVAYATYQRMSNKDKGPIKSVLNYMKSVLSFRKTAFNIQRRQKIIDPQFDEAWDSIAYIERCKNSYEASNRGGIFEGVEEVLKTVPSIVEHSIPKVFKLNKIEFRNIYISCLLSLLSSITLPNIYDSKFDRRKDTPSFDEVKFYSKYLKDDIILWNLPNSMSNVVKLTLNKTKSELIDEIKDLSSDIHISDDDFANIMSSGFITGGANEAAY